MADNELAITGKDPRMVLRDRFESRKTELRNALPPDISVDAFIRAAMTSTQLNQDILACTWQSIWDACMKACRAGLLPDGIEAALVPYKTRAAFIPMVQGVLRSARRSGQIRSISADVVREGEIFMHEVTHEGEIFRHVSGDDYSARIVRAYAVANTKDGGFYSAVMSLAEINKHRAFSRASREDSPWNQWFEAMAIKTAIHKLGKMLPSVRDAIKEDDSFTDLPPTLPPAPQLVTSNDSASLAAKSVTPTAADGEIGGVQEPQPGDMPDSIPPDEPAAAGHRFGPDEDIKSPRDANGPVMDAYERGKADKARGLQARAVPPEFREANRTREALGWQAGWAGQSLPKFSE